MPSPFPGMDPYLEEHWRDVHHNLITFAQGALNAVLPRGLRARVEERICVESPDSPTRAIYPDVRVVDGRPDAEESTAVAAVLEGPILVAVEEEQAAEGFIEIVDSASGSAVVTVIEALSISNKQPGDGQDLYRRKQREVIAGGVNLVEIDLLRAGQRVLAVPLHRIPRSHRTTYQGCVRRGARPGVAEVYAAPLRSRLPILSIPLRPTDGDVALDLQALIDRCHANGRYDELDYSRDPSPPLDSADAAWADELLRAVGKR